MRLKRNFIDKKLVVFDLDGTLTESKAALGPEVGRLLCELLKKKLVAVIGGGGYGQFQKQFLQKLKCPKTLLKNLFIFPTCSTSFYQHRDNWKRVYALHLSSIEKKKILSAFQKTFLKLNYSPPKRVYGEIIEDRDTQITFSALGQKAPVPLKKKWNKENDLRPRLRKILQKYLPQFEVRMGGLTSIDVTRKGIDKAYGLRQIEKYLRIPLKDMVFVGDALFPGGNDYAARKTGVDCVSVSGPKETKKFIRFLLAHG